ncbi:hypothetical protein BH10BAC1_BH10BAC1_11560 [soil metagenome]
MKKQKEKRKGNILRKEKVTPNVLQVYSEKKGIKKLVKKYASLIASKKMPLDEALENMGKDYSAFMHKCYAYSHINHPIMPYFEGIATKDSDFYDIFDRRYENFKRPKKVISMSENARYDIFGYKDSYVAVEVGKTSNRRKISDLWYEYDGMKKIPKKHTMQGIVFDKAIDKTDTALIENTGKRKLVPIREIILNEYLVEYND